MNDFLNNYGSDKVVETKKIKQKRKYKLPKYLIYLVISFVIAISLVLLFVNNGVKVLDFTGWKLSDAKIWATTNKINIRNNSVFSEELEEGIVISQNLKEGTKINKDDFIELTISKGVDYSVVIDIPDLLKMSVVQVEDWANKNHLKTLRIKSEISEDVPVGHVISYYVNEEVSLEKTIKRDSPLYVVVSKGKDEKTAFELANLKMMSESDIKTYFEEKGLILNLVKVYNDEIGKGAVISQSIKEKTKVYPKDEVTVTISLGKKIVINDYYNLVKEETLLLLNKDGINYLVDETYSNKPNGQLIYQSIEPNTIYNEELLKLTYSLGNQIRVDSFEGRSLDSLYSFIDGYNQKGTNIKVEVKTTNSSSDINTIISQDVIGNINYDATIKVIVSKGPVIYMPNFVNEKNREAVMALSDSLKIVPIFIEQVDDSKLPGVILSQSIQPNTEISQNQRFEVTYNSLNVKFKTPNFIGLTINKIKELGYEDLFIIEYQGTVSETAIVTSQSIIKDELVNFKSNIIINLT